MRYISHLIRHKDVKLTYDVDLTAICGLVGPGMTFTGALGPLFWRENAMFQGINLTEST